MQDKIILELSPLDALNIAALLDHFKQENGKTVIVPECLLQSADRYRNALAENMSDDVYRSAIAESAVNNLLNETIG